MVNITYYLPLHQTQRQKKSSLLIKFVTFLNLVQRLVCSLLSIICYLFHCHSCRLFINVILSLYLQPFVTIKFRTPPKTLTVSVPKSESQVLNFARTLEGLRRGDEKLSKAVPCVENFTREISKIQPRVLYIEGNNYESKQLANNSLTKVTFHGTKCLLPKGIWRLNNLTELHLTECDLQQFPERLVNLKSLNVLDLSKNQITKVNGNVLTDFKNLKLLNLSHNLIYYIPIEILYLARCLISLDISHNRLTSLPYTLAYMSGLKTLNVSHNRLTHFPDSIINPSLRKPSLTRLRLDSLDISGNEMNNEIPSPVGSCTIISESFIDQNGHKGSETLPKLKEISASAVIRKVINLQLINEWLPRTVYEYLQEGSATCFRCKRSCIAYSRTVVETSARYSQISSTVTSDASTSLIPVVQFNCFFCASRLRNPM